MFLELSKDKSLLNVLSKTQLDNETQSLVKNNASVSEIKKSLIKNINSDNMVLYRKLIKKAEDEEYETGTEADSLEEDDEDADIDVYEEEAIYDDKSRSIESDLLQRNKEKKAYREISELSERVDVLEEIVREAEVVREGSKNKVYAMKPYLKIGSNPKESNELIVALQSMKDSPNYLLEKYNEFLVEGKISGKIYQTDDEGKLVVETRVDSDINVEELQNRLNNIFAARFSIEGSENKLDIIAILGLLHIQKHKYSPPTMKDKKRRKRELQDIGLKLKGKSPKDKREHNKELNKLNKLNDKINSVKSKALIVEEGIQELEDILKDTDKLVTKKIQTLNKKLKDAISQRDLSPKQIQDRMAQIKDIRDNPDKFVEEIKTEIEREINIEKQKLNRYLIDIKAAERVKEPTMRFKRYMKMFSESEPFDILKKKFTKGMLLVRKLTFKAIKMEKLIAQSSGQIEQGIDSFLLSDPSRTITFSADGIDFDGLPTIDVEGTMKMADLSKQFDELAEELESVVNEIESMIESEKPEGDAE